VNRTIEIAVVESSQVGEARRAATGLAVASGLNEGDAGRASLIVTELATNLVKHAREGVILLRAVPRSGWLDILALDRGPGMHAPQAMRDGFSTAGSPGTGLGAVQRQADLFEMHTREGEGTVVLSRVTAERRKPTGVPHAGISVPHAGESENGDCWAAAELPGGATIFLVVDGLGHGALAAEAARAACEAMAGHEEETPGALAARVHGALRATRGAAIGVARMDRARAELTFCGVGNIAGSIVAPAARRSIVSMHGIAGHQVNGFREFRYDLPAGSVMVLHSDGISAKWDLTPYGRVLTRDPALIAALIWRDFRRTNDDATIVAARV
jgi:anti-sigma regulatory factor (Ser/Thr protein kinase)